MYDAIGNPTTYYNGTQYSNMMWEQGRNLVYLMMGTSYVSFEYNDQGIRTSKTTSSGTTYNYILDGTRIVAETWDDELLIFLYDDNGSPIGMQSRYSGYADGEFDTYWFEKNLQGDIIAVYNENGVKLVTYTYDAWGNFTTTYCNGGENDYALDFNPFRYRGYYYDEETGFYYLNSRYYDPVTGRFINADSILNQTSLIGNNMYAYCANNPVMYIDPTGELFVSITAICIAAGIIAGTIIGGYIGTQYAESMGVSEEDQWKYKLGGAFVGGIVGGFAGYVVAPTVAAVTGISGISITATGITTVGVSSTIPQIVENTVTAIQPYYPPNNGFSGVIEKVTLAPGTLIQRTGDFAGRFVAPAGTPIQMLSLPYEKIGQPTTFFQLQQPLQVLSGRVLPWFGQMGGGIQYLLLDGTVEQLMRDGAIKIFGG